MRDWRNLNDIERQFYTRMCRGLAIPRHYVFINVPLHLRIHDRLRYRP